ncbi:shikimate kinase [Desulfurobacterium sp.]
MKISLIGFMGCGKSTVGRLLSKKLNFPFIDIDEEIGKKVGTSIPEIFRQFGEDFFREKEIEIFKAIISNFDKVIISTGGGMPSYKNNLKILNERSISIYLKADFETLWERIKADSNRPLVKRGKNELMKLYKTRENFYKKAKIIINTQNKTPEQIANEIIEKIVK